ncbi:MAG: peroxidase-related enzyme [Chitinophagaceae bacterium]
MSFINVNEQLPGIRSLLAFRPEVAGPLADLANILLRDENGLSPAEREMIGAHVSYLNDCFYCQHSHAAIACEYLNGNTGLVEQVRIYGAEASVSPKLSSLLRIAASVQQSGRAVTADQVLQAKGHGATDREIHDTVLIAALFCLFNRYVDGLAANTPTDLSSYPFRAREVVDTGYGGRAISLAKQPDTL